jgi:hypothetical protein
VELEQWLFLGLAALLVWLPIPLGSNRPWAWTVMEVVAFVLLGLWIFGWATERMKPGAALKARVAGVDRAGCVDRRAGAEHRRAASRTGGPPVAEVRRDPRAGA